MGRIIRPGRQVVNRPIPQRDSRLPDCKKVLVFCTAWSDSQERWVKLYARWIRAIKSCKLIHHQIFLPDDGSPVLPTFPDVVITGELPDEQLQEKVVMYHWPDNLGIINPSSNHPGWYRSYTMAAIYANKYGFDKVVHIEADAFLISDRMYDYINQINKGWTTFWCPKYHFGENAIQVIAGDSLHKYLTLSKSPYTELVGKLAEHYTPFSHVEGCLVGDRYGEGRREVPRDADYACQITQDMDCWWLNQV